MQTHILIHIVEDGKVTPTLVPLTTTAFALHEGKTYVYSSIGETQIHEIQETLDQLYHTIGIKPA